MKPHELRSGESEEPANGNAEKEDLAEAQQAAAMQHFRIPPILLEGDQPPGEPAATVVQQQISDQGLNSTGKPPEGEELPEAYGTGQLRLVARDPHCLYAHWDLTSAQQHQHCSRAQDNSLMVKVHDENRPELPVSQIQVSPQSRHLFIPVESSGSNYVAELGYFDIDRNWKSVAISEPATTPVETAGEEREIRFITNRLESVLGESSEPEAFPTQPKRESPGEPQPVRADLPPSLAEPGLAGGSPDLERRERWLQQPQAPAGRQLEFQTGPKLEPLKHAPEWTAAKGAALAELIGWSIARPTEAGSAEIAQMISDRLEVSSDQPMQLELPGPSDIISSPVGGELPKLKGFWFNVNAELVVYGATEPSAQVTLGGRPIELRADGTFSFRFALPDGKYVLPATAYSTGGDMRRAEMEFQRDTRYFGEVGVPPQETGLAAPALQTRG